MSDKENKVVETSKKTTEKKAKAKAKGQGRLSKFFKDYKSEINKIVWPSKETTLKSTCMVIVCLVVSAAVVGALDLGAGKLMDLLVSLVK